MDFREKTRKGRKISGYIQSIGFLTFPAESSIVKFVKWCTKEVKKEKTSAAKVGLGILTGGASLLVTGTKNKKHNEYFCRDCGNRWIGK